jgi:hypothetical protein
MKIQSLMVILGLMASSLAHAQGIDFQLAKMKSGSYKCEVFFNVTNNSGLNITFGNADIALREKDGSIISKDTLLFRRIKKGQTEVATTLVTGGGDCSIIKTIRLQLIAVSIDGDLTTSDKVLSNLNDGKKSSRISGVVVE